MKLQPLWMLLALAVGLPAGAGSLSATQLTYDVSWTGIPLGSGTLTLTPEADDCYRYELATNPVGVVSLVYGAPKETSNFCVKNGAVVPSSMSFNNPKRSKDGFVLTFDFAKGLLLGGRNGPLEIKPGTLDRLSVQQAARLWVKTHINDAKPGTLVTPVADHKRVKTYTFAIKGKSQIETPAGTFEAIQFERIDDPNTTLRFWLAPEKDYMPVKVQNIEDGEDKVSLTLKKSG
ncbi:MAG: DUF3108 domain-containing protein [Stagnimonas sp.]|nr:DUF3108 domain-containing protein [Stagnimonas sp.]